MIKTLSLKIINKDVTLSLCESGAVCAWVDDNDLLEEFYHRLQELLESQSTTLGEIDAYECDVSKAQGLTTARIAQTIMGTFAFAHDKPYEFKEQIH